jgi:arylsulfatase A-like enzyme
MPFSLKYAHRSDVRCADSLETWTTDQCLAFLDDCARSPSRKPFFAWLTYDRPHSPTTLPAEWYDRIRPEQFQLYPEPTSDDLLAMTPALFHEYARRDSRLALGTANFRFILATYYTLMEFIDSEIGRVMDRLAKLGLDRTTTIVFTSDHGDEAGYRGLYNKADGVSSEEICRVPLIIRPAPCLGAAPAAECRCDAPVELVDIYPTLTELAQVAASPGCEGVSLAREIVAREPLDAERAMFCEHLHIRSIAWGGWKLSWAALRAECSLFDLRQDPHGMRNLYRSQDQAHAEIRLELKRRLLAFLMRRRHGGYTAADVAWIERAFDPASGQLGLCLCTDLDQVQHFRAGAFVQRGGRQLFVPFYAGRSVTLFPKGNYHKWPAALPFDAQQADELLDAALTELFEGYHSVSVLYRWLPRLEPTPANVRELLARNPPPVPAANR